MKFRERKQKHDDAHFPMGGKGKKATPPRKILLIPQEIIWHCKLCNTQVLLGSDHYCGEIDVRRGSHWKTSMEDNSKAIEGEKP